MVTLRSLGARARPYAAPLAVSATLGAIAINAILERAGGPAMPLDDSFIHLVYARRIAELRPFTFGLGEGFSSGATSFLWPLLLSPFYAIGLRGVSLVWAIWLLGTVFHAAVALETRRLVEPLAGRAAAVGAAAMCLLFGAFAWFAWSGMETIALAWALVRTARVASEYAETPLAERTRRQALGVAAIGAIAPLLRPEGALASGCAAAVLLAFGPASTTAATRVARLSARWPALLPVMGVALVPLLNLTMTGHFRSNTAIVKWAVGNPYYVGERLWGVIGAHVKMLLTDLLAGGPYTAIFMPEHIHYALALGAIALFSAGVRKKKLPRLLLIVALLLGTLIPCTFLTILWNRVRYIWPFAPGWFVLLACLAGELQALAQRVKRDADFVAGVVSGIFAGLFAAKLPWAVADLANSARAINEQQVKLGLWARDQLPEDARIGLNDTGAIAYFSERRTFDVVGLTTEGEARYWVAGAGSRYEHYERMPAEARPTHFIVYPQWMAIPPVLGRRLFEATVTDQSILGGGTKVAYEARWDVLGRADLPLLVEPEGRLIAEVDVSDLESEAEHAYELLWASDSENIVRTHWDDEDGEIADGGRSHRNFERFSVDLEEGSPTKLVARLGADDPLKLAVYVDGTRVASIDAPEAPFVEVEAELPAEAAGPRRQIVIRTDPDDPDSLARTFTSMHYWFYASAEKR
jgi:hypothetical protein